MTVGTWRPVFVHAYSVRITDLRALPVVADDYSVELDVMLKLSDAAPGAKANVSFKGPDGKLVIGMDSLDVSSGKGVAQFKFAKGTLKLWYPVGYGKQPQYTVDVEILSGASVHPDRSVVSRVHHFHLHRKEQSSTAKRRKSVFARSEWSRTSSSIRRDARSSSK